MRLLHGMRRPANWLQLVRFGLVGAIGFVVNLGGLHPARAPCRGSTTGSRRSIGVAGRGAQQLRAQPPLDVRRRAGRARFQAIRFFLVSLVAEGFSLVLLTLLVEGAGLAKVPAQALAVAASMPLNFLGNKLWSFRAGRGLAPAPARG